MPHARLLALLILFVLPALPAQAGETSRENAIQLPDSLALTPDGATVVFSWRDDLWSVPRAGGPARRLTFHPGRDTRPYVSPDGRRIAFVSNRSGTDQVHVMPVDGGQPTQVTTHSEGARLLGWFPGSRHVLVRSSRDHHWRAADRFFRQPVDAEQPGELLFDAACGTGDVSPDGTTIAFTREGMAWWRKGYRGPKAAQIWLYSLATKSFRRLSQGNHGELWPLWGGGNLLYYVSEESGCWNLWRRDVTTDEKTQVTFFDDDGVSFPAISHDRSRIVFRRLFDMLCIGTDTLAIDTNTNANPERIVAFDTGDPSIETLERRAVTRATHAAFTDDAREIAFVAGGDLWVMDTELKEPKRVTSTPDEERDPVFSADFDALYFVSDAGGTSDIWKARRADETRFWWQNDEFLVERVTHDDAVESAVRLTPDGKRLAYLRGTDLWISALDGTEARRIASSFVGMDYSFSPDGRWVAYARPDDDFNWDVWIAAVDGSREPFNVSRHPDNDGDPVWSPDGKILAFSGRRWGEESDICYVWLRREDDETDQRDRALEKALAKMKGRKGNVAKGNGATGKGGKAQASSPKAPADPKPEPKSDAAEDPLAGTWQGRLTGAEPLPPDGLDLVLAITRQEDGSYACSVEVVGQFSGAAEQVAHDPKTGELRFALKTPLGPLSGVGKIQGERMEGTWSIPGVMEGAFEVRRRAAAKDAGPDEPDKPAPEAEAASPAKKPEEPKPTAIDFEGLEDRIRRIAIADTEERDLFWSHDSSKLAFGASVGGKPGIYTVTFPDDLKPKLLTATRGTGARWLKEGNQIAWLSGGTPATVTASGRTTSYGFGARQEVFLPELHAAAFDQAWRIMRDSYYDPRMGGADWDAVRAKYAPMAARCLTRSELELVVNLMLGELNGSHLGFRALGGEWRRPGWRDVTGHLGCRFDPAWQGEGLRVRDVVPGTPADEARHRIRPGEVILSIDGRPVSGATDLDRLLTGDPRRTLAVEVRNEGGEARTLQMQPTDYPAVRRRLYEHWIEATRKRVEEASGGRLGYLHVRSMNWSSFQQFEAELYKVGFGKDGLLIDVRDNGGGFTTDHLLTCLTQPRHAITVPRRGGPGYPHDRMVYAPWDKPVVVLCNQNSFSNAEIFAHAIQSLDRGPVVGVQTAGGVISTGGTTVMDLGTLRLPFRGWFLRENGEDMEMNGCKPDHIVWPEPADLAAGIDRQVAKAVEVGLAEVEAWKQRPRPKLRYASERK